MRFRKYLKEDYFEVAVVQGDTSSANTETHIFPDAKNKKEAKKQAEYQFNKDYGRGKYEIISIRREKGNPGTYQGRQEKKKSRYDPIWETKFQSIRHYEKIAAQYVEKFGREAKNEFMKTRPPMKGGSDVIQGQQSEAELRREVFKAIDKLSKRLKR